MAVIQRDISWTPSYRLISRRYQAISFFEDVADPEDWESVFEIAKLTDPSFDVGDLGRIEIEDRLTQPGAGWVIPSFSFLCPARFNGTSFGAYYASEDMETALAETIYHRTKVLHDSDAPAQELDQLLILADIAGSFDHIVDLKESRPKIYHMDNYKFAQSFAETRHSEDSFGIVYRSVRNPGGKCIAVFRARVISNIREGGHYTYVWNGSRIESYYKKSDLKKLS